MGEGLSEGVRLTVEPLAQALTQRPSPHHPCGPGPLKPCHQGDHRNKAQRGPGHRTRTWRVPSWVERAFTCSRELTGLGALSVGKGARQKGTDHLEPQHPTPLPFASAAQGDGALGGDSMPGSDECASTELPPAPGTLTTFQVSAHSHLNSAKSESSKLAWTETKLRHHSEASPGLCS